MRPRLVDEKFGSAAVKSAPGKRLFRDTREEIGRVIAIVVAVIPVTSIRTRTFEARGALDSGRIFVWRRDKSCRRADVPTSLTRGSRPRTEREISAGLFRFQLGGGKINLTRIREYACDWLVFACLLAPATQSPTVFSSRMISRISDLETLPRRCFRRCCMTRHWSPYYFT